MYYRPQRFQILPPVIKNLLIINGLAFVALLVFQTTFGLNLNAYLGLFFPASEYFEPYQIVTHMFMHGSLTHIFFNMFALWMFGAPLENLWGSKRFLIYYLITGFGAAVLHEGVMALEYYGFLYEIGPQARQALLYIPTVGASGAVYGILLGFGMTYPNQPIYLYFLFPIKAKYFVTIFGALELWNGLSNTGSNIAHFAHVGGMIFGYFLILSWRKRRRY